MRDVKRLIACLVRGHRWDPAPDRAPGLMRCVRCGTVTEPVPHLH
jgi:hypothetical protein